MKNEQRLLRKKITREQARLEDFGEVIITQDNRSIQVYRVTVDGGIGYRVAGLTPIHARPEQAIAAARNELGNTFGIKIGQAVIDGAIIGRLILGNGLRHVGLGLAIAGEFAQRFASEKTGELAD